MEENFKDCHNEEIQKKLDRKITKAKYGNFKPVIDEVFQRRFYEFGDLLEFDIDQEIENFVRNVRGISYNSKLNVLAAYKTSPIFGGRILLNKSKINENTPEELLNIFVHEVGHAITDRKNNEHGLLKKITIPEMIRREYSSMKTGKYENIIFGTALNEVFTEATASRLMYSEDVNQFEVNSLGYPSITFSVPFLANALGIPEKQLLQAGNQSRDVLMKKILEKFPSESQEQAGKIFENFEKNLESLYSEIYEMRTNLGLTQKFGDMISGIYDLAQLQISQDTREINSDVLAELVYRNTRMEQISNRIMNSLVEGKSLKPEEAEKTKLLFSKSQTQTSDLVYDIYRKNPSHTNVSQEQYKENLEKEQFDSGKQWDNSIATYFSGLVEREEKTGVFNNAINNIMNLFKRGRIPKLGQAKDENTSEKLMDDFNTMKQYEVKVPELSKEELDRILDKQEKNEEQEKNSSSREDDL